MTLLGMHARNIMCAHAGGVACAAGCDDIHTMPCPGVRVSGMVSMQHAVPQVLVGAHALLANGGVMAGAGNQLTAMAAKHHAVPFVVLVGLQKLSPLFPHDPSVSFNDYKVRPLHAPDGDVLKQDLDSALAADVTVMVASAYHCCSDMSVCFGSDQGKYAACKVAIQHHAGLANDWMVEAF